MHPVEQPKYHRATIQAQRWRFLKIVNYLFMKVPSSLPIVFTRKVPFSLLYYWTKLLNQHSQQNLQSTVIKIKRDNKSLNNFALFILLTLRRPLRRKLQLRWFVDVSKVKESSFFKSDLTDLHQIFDGHLLETTDLSSSRFYF